MLRALIAYREKNLQGDFASQAYWVLQEKGHAEPGVLIETQSENNTLATLKSYFSTALPPESKAKDTIYLFDKQWNLGAYSVCLVHMELTSDEISALSAKGIEPKRMPDILRGMSANKLRLPVLQAFQLLMGADKIELKAELTKN